MDIMAARVVLIDGFTLQLGGEGPGASVVDLPRAVQRLVAYVGLSHRLARTAVAGQLWPDVSDAQAQSSLRSALWRLQKAAPGLLDASAGTLTLARGVWSHRPPPEAFLNTLSGRTSEDHEHMRA
jgi:hypothetical protein